MAKVDIDEHTDLAIEYGVRTSSLNSHTFTHTVVFQVKNHTVRHHAGRQQRMTYKSSQQPYEERSERRARILREHRKEQV